LNTVSPRFYPEVFSSTTENGNFLQVDSSVMNFFTSDDESIPRDLVLDANGNERFWKYKVHNFNYGGTVHDNVVNYVKNYPYPYVIDNNCWQFPCVAPSDWSAQHLHGVNNPVTVEDWKAALDITVHKQGVFNLIFHPHGWIKAEQVVELIDHAVAKHGKKVKFLNFREAAERLNGSLTGNEPLRLATERSPHFPKSLASDTAGVPPEILDEIASPTHKKLLPIRRTDGTQNGFFIHDRHLCWINEDTAHFPDFMYSVSFDEILAEHEKASGGASAPRENAPGNARGADAAPLADTEPVPIGAAVIDITPDYLVRLTGYGNRMKESEGVAVKIHARALVVGGNESENRVLSQNQSPLSPVERLATPKTDPTGERTRVRGQENNAEAAANSQSQTAASSPPIPP
ncbi:MAG TPA: hypothetical protein PLY87_12785, partial [Planctomycetaceae bacterium]|nr:hypothetical protein [Planctomycetaceae bacterium]